MTVVPFFEDGRYETKWENCFQKYEYNLHNWEMPHFSVSNKSPIREVVFGRFSHIGGLCKTIYWFISEH